MAKISVIIPVYNTAEYMDDCMNSVISQTFKDIEIILVDDGSTDGISPQKCDDYAAKDSRVKVIHKENGGLMSAWIAGVCEASSDYVSFIDSDDWVDTDMFEKLYSLTDSTYSRYEMISGNYIVEKAGERRKEAQGLEPGVYTGKDLEEIRTRLLGCERRTVTMSRCMKLTSRELILNNLKYCDPSISMSEDVNITLPCLCDCKRLVIAKDSYFYHYRLVSDSIAHSYKSKLLENFELTDKTFREILKEKGVTNADEQMDREFVMMLLLVMKNELRCTEKDTLKRVQKVFLRPDIRQKLSDTKVEIKGASNRLLYFAMKHPNGLTVGFMKSLISYYDRKTN
jgi:glycosyltransferase involved in cell wall biosynthesis